MATLANLELAQDPSENAGDAMPVDPMKALVIADDIGVFLPIARSLGRAGIHVEVATCGEDYPGLASRYIKAVHCLPPYLSASSDWSSELCKLVERGGHRLVFPSSDSSLSLLHSAADRIDPARLAIPNKAAFAAFSDKSKTRQLARSLGVSIAQGWEGDAGPEALNFATSIGLPLAVKPSEPYELGGKESKSSARIVKTDAELAGAIEDFGGRRIVIEEFFEGDGVGVSVLAQDGDVHFVWQHRREACASQTGRSSRRIGEAPDQRLVDDVTKLAKATALNGVAMFEFRQNVHSGDHILLEVNPRYWGSLPLALAGGADFPFYHWQMLTGLPRDEPKEFAARGVRKANLVGEFDRLSDVGGGSIEKLQTAFELSKLVTSASFAPARFDGWADDDPKPHWQELRQVWKRCCAALIRRIRWS